MSDHEAGFLADILADPEDDTVRLIYADWLEDNGKPKRANVIRQMIANPELFRGQQPAVSMQKSIHLPDAVHDAYEWLSLYSDREILERYGIASEPIPGDWVWIRRHVGIMGKLHWIRGFVGGVTLPWYRFRYDTIPLFSVFPIEQVELSDCHPEVLERDSGSLLVYCWNRDAATESDWPDAEESSYLDSELFDLLPRQSLHQGNNIVLYPTEKAARESLAVAALALARKWIEASRRGEDE